MDRITEIYEAHERFLESGGKPVTVGREQPMRRDSFLHPAVFKYVMNCPDCGERMSFWRNKEGRPEHSFRYELCRKCGSVYVLESDVFAVSRSVDVRREGSRKFLAGVINGSRRAGLLIKDENELAAALVSENIYIVFINKERELVDAWDAAHPKAEHFPTLAPKEEVGAFVTVNYVLARNRAAAEEKRESAKKVLNFLCRYCSKKFETKQERNNHRCNGLNGEHYGEAVRKRALASVSS